MINIGLVNPKDADNVGSVLRAIGCYGADSLFYSGNRYDYAARHHTDTKKIRSIIDMHKVESMLEAKQMLPEGGRLVCVELVVGAKSLPDYQHPEHALYVFGPEDGSLPQELVSAADDVVYIPTIGCMNLAATVNVVLYDRLVKLGSASKECGDEMIIKVRDNRNRLVR